MNSNTPRMKQRTTALCTNSIRPISSIVFDVRPPAYITGNTGIIGGGLTPLTPAVPNCCCSKGSAPYWSNLPFLIFDIQGSAVKGLRKGAGGTAPPVKSLAPCGPKDPK